MRTAFAASVAFFLWVSAPASADPIQGLTYTYDLSTPDMDPGGFEVFIRPHVDADDTDDATDPTAITSNGLLTDGELGSTDLTDPVFGCCLYDNDTYAGFRGDPGIGLAPKPKIDVDLGGTFTLNSFTLHYLVEDQPSIYSPQPIPDGAGGNLFDALTVYGSTDGVNFEPLGFTNEFTPVFGPEGDVGSGAREVRIATIDLAGDSASHLSIDVRTPFSFIFLGEFIVDAEIAGSPADFDGDGDVDGGDFLVWQRNFGGSGPAGDANDDGDVDGDDLATWRSSFGASAAPTGTAIPEPVGAWLATAAALGLAQSARRGNCGFRPHNPASLRHGAYRSPLLAE